MAKPETYEIAIDRIWAEKIRPLLIERQAKYGPNNVGESGLVGIATRIGDKCARLKNFVMGNGHNAPDESLEDTFTDLCGHSIIGLMWLKGWWGVPLERHD